jgi:hypothetical protein
MNGTKKMETGVETREAVTTGQESIVVSESETDRETEREERTGMSVECRGV